MVIAMVSKTLISLCLSLILMTAVAYARNVDLSTVPDRQSVQLTIYNSEDLTLVRETRIVTSIFLIIKVSSNLTL